MSSKLAICGVCEYRKINKPSDVWCSECDEGLCGECKEHHSSSKGTRNHHIVPVSEYQNLPSNILEITQTCPKHDDKYVIFCKKHDCPCCRRCVTETHNDCKEIDVIDDVITNVKSSNAFLEIEHSLAELSENLQRIRKDRQENIKSLLENRANIEKEVNKTRKLIDNHLNKLQKSLIKELYAAEEKESTKIKNIISSVEETERTISESQTTLDKIKQHASDLQTFLALKHIQRDVTNNELFLESLIKEEKMNHVSMSWKMDKSVEIIPTTIKKIGTIILDTRSCDATLTNRKNTQAQIMTPIRHVPTIDDIKLTLRNTVKTIGYDNTDCTLLHDGRMIFPRSESPTLQVFKMDGTLDFTLEPGFVTSHIYYIEENQKLVVTSGFYNKYIKIVDMKNRKTEKSISVGSFNFGIVHKDGKLFYNGSKDGLCVLKLEDNSITKLVDVPLSPFSSIAIWSDNLYFINNDGSLTCCDLQGGVRWKLELKAFLSEPRGITVDNYGHVYISGYRSNNIGVISPDGNKHRILLLEKDGIKSPHAMCFDRKNNKLLVANHQNVALLYEVSS